MLYIFVQKLLNKYYNLKFFICFVWNKTLVTWKELPIFLLTVHTRVLLSFMKNDFKGNFGTSYTKVKITFTLLISDRLHAIYYTKLEKRKALTCLIILSAKLIIYKQRIHIKTFAKFVWICSKKFMFYNKTKVNYLMFTLHNPVQKRLGRWV